MGNWDVLSRKRRSRALRRSIFTLSPSKSMRSSTSSLDQHSRMRFSRSCLSRSRPKPVRELDSRLSLPLETTTDMLVLVSSAPRRWQLPSEEQLSWLSFPLFQSDVVSGETRSVVLTPSLARLLASVELALFLLQFPRSCSRWLELTIVIPLLVAQLALLVTSPRLPMLPLLLPTPI